jgi:hypothetical protein
VDADIESHSVMSLKNQIAAVSLLIAGVSVVGAFPSAHAQEAPASAAAPAEAVPPAQAAAVIPRDTLIEGLLTRLRAVPGVRAASHSEADPEVITIITYRTFQLYLPRVDARIATSGLVGDNALDMIVSQTAEGMEFDNPFKLEAFRVVVRPTAAVDSFEQMTAAGGQPNRVVRRFFAPGLDEVLVANTGTTMAYVPVPQLARLRVGETDAFSWGRIHTEEMARAVRFEEEDGIRIAILDGNFETSLLAIDRLWTQVSEDMGGSIAVIMPTRSRLLVARTSDARAMARLRDIARAEGQGEHGLSDRVFLRQGRNWVPQ